MWGGGGSCREGGGGGGGLCGPLGNNGELTTILNGTTVQTELLIYLYFVTILTGPQSR